MKNELKAEKLENDFLDASQERESQYSTLEWFLRLINFALWEVIR